MVTSIPEKVINGDIIEVSRPQIVKRMI